MIVSLAIQVYGFTMSLSLLGHNISITYYLILELDQITS